MSEVYMGPTVYEMACQRIRDITRQIAELQAEKRACEKRMNEYRGYMMLEAERVATAVEVYMDTLLPVCKCPETICPVHDSIDQSELKAGRRVRK